MAAAVTAGDTLTSMNGLVKEKYAEHIQNAVPDSAKLFKRTRFSKKSAVGNYYHQPVILQNEVGFTYAAGNSGLFGYNPVMPMQMKDAQVAPTQLLLRSAVGYEVMNRAKAAGPEAFEAATLLLIQNMVDSMGLRLEMSLLYGGSGLATLHSAAARTSSGNTSATVITVTSSQWAVGLWQGQESSYLDFYNGSSPVNGTSVAANAPQLTTINPGSKTITVTGNQSDIDAIIAAVNGNVDVITVWWGGSYGAEMVGLKTILTNTGSLFGIDASVYDLWRGNQVTTTGELTQALIQQTVAVCAARGLQDEDLLLVCSNQGWADLMTSQAALRMYDSSYSSGKTKNGSKELEFASQNGTITVMAHPMCKDGDAFLLPMKQLIRVGACEPTFEQPGVEQRLPFIPLENNAGVQIVRYASQQIFLQTPSRAAYISGITNSSSAS